MISICLLTLVNCVGKKAEPGDTKAKYIDFVDITKMAEVTLEPLFIETSKVLDTEKFFYDREQLQEEVFTISGNVDEIGDIEEGDIIAIMPISDAESGLLRRVSKVEIRDGLVFIETKPAIFEDVFEEVGFEVRQSISPEELDLESIHATDGASCHLGKQAIGGRLLTCEFKDVVVYELEGIKPGINSREGKKLALKAI